MRRPLLAALLTGATFAHLFPALCQARLAIQIQSSNPSYGDPSAFEFSVIVQNRGDFTLVVLPGAIRRDYSALDSGSAGYLPHPGPRTPPWGARSPSSRARRLRSLSLECAMGTDRGMSRRGVTNCA